MATEESTRAAAEPAPAPTRVKVTAKEDCNLLINGQSVALTAGQEVEMTPEEAKAYADLGLVEVSGGSERAVPKRK